MVIGFFGDKVMANLTDQIIKLTKSGINIAKLLDPGRSAFVALIIVTVASAVYAVQTNINGPAGSTGRFGEKVVVLSNGNFVVVDTLFVDAGNSVGAVHLYDGTTLALISSLKGSTPGDNVGSGIITPLANGNFVVSNPNWDNAGIVNAGAVTWCSGVTGCNGAISATNSLVGGTAGDQIGLNWVTALKFGNYVVASSLWDNTVGPISDAGAVTWCNGTVGCVGFVTTANSLTGGMAGNLVGNGGVRALNNGNYVSASFDWDNPVGPVSNVGAVTWGNGSTGTTGLVSSSNSIIGSTANDQVGRGGGGNRIAALTNGNYVVPTQSWDNPSGPISDVGAVTWCNGNGGTVGVVTAANSLIGGTSNDWVGVEGVTALSNGNYVVNSALNWRDPSTSLSVGAVTWGNGNGGTVGLVSASNSLIGGRSLDRVGIGGIVALTNGNYVVNSYGWDNPTGPIANVGAVTFGNGNGGTVGLVTPSNSLVGGRADDNVGQRTIALTNGNYVTSTQFWDNPTGPVNSVGAATWCSGTAGRTGLVTTANSLTGSKSSDSVGTSLTALLNGNYVVGSSGWLTASFVSVGASTWGNGATGTTGTVATSNSLTGSTNLDSISNFGITALANGNYVVNSPQWDNPIGPVSNVGAATFANGTSAFVASASNLNSLIGGTSGDSVSSALGTQALANGNYVILSRDWDNPTGPVVNAGAVTLGNGSVGTVGTLSTVNTVMGNILNEGGSLIYAFNDIGNYLIVGRSNSISAQPITILSNSSFTAAGNGDFNNPTTWGGTPPSGVDTGVIPPSVIVFVPFGQNNMAGLVNVNGTLNGAGTLTSNVVTNVGGTLAPGTSPGMLTVNGNVNLKNGSIFAAEINGTTVGTQYDQLKVNGSVVLDNPTLSMTFGFTPSLGNAFRLIDNDGMDPISGMFNGIPEGKRIGLPGFRVANFSYFGGDGNDFVVTISLISAADATISGRVFTRDGAGLRNAAVVLTDETGIVSAVRTSSFGYFSFSGVEVGRTYILSVSSKRFLFEPKVVTVTDDLSEIEFIPL